MSQASHARLRRLLAAPRFSDEEATRVAGILHTILLAGIGICIVSGATQTVLAGDDGGTYWLYLVLGLLCAGLLLALHRGYVRFSGLALLLAVWSSTTFHAYVNGGVRSPVAGGLTLVVIVAALLFGRATLHAFIALCAVTLAALVVLDHRGMLPPANDGGVMLAFTAHLFQLLSAGVFLWLVVRNLHGTLARARAGEARAEQLLREAEGARSYADNILASMAESLIVLDARGRVQTVNRATLTLLGTTAEQLLGQPFTYILPEFVVGRVDATAPGEAPTLSERQYRTPDGRLVPVLFGRTILRGERGEPVGAVCVASDITHLKQTEASLREAKELAEEANHAKSRFLANMSHELRTPLNAVIGYAEMLIEEVEDRNLHDSLDDLKKIQFAGKHLLGLISDILDLSKIEAGRMDIHLETFDVADMIETVLGTIRPLADRSGNKIVVSVQDGIGFIHADMTKIRQILLNLLSNAVKFTAKGEIRLTASKVLMGTQAGVQYMVADTGIGMTQQQLGKLFQAFSQGDSSTSRKFGGTGLGLAISKAFCDMLGGTIEVTSQLGVGTVFTVRLPYTDPHDMSLSRRSGFFPRSIADAARAAAARAHQLKAPEKK